MTKVYLVRHAEAEGNLYGRPHAWYDGHLTSLGRRQIKAFARRVENIDFAAVYSSDLQRTMKTARAVLATRPGMKLNVTTRLRELHLGIWEDTTWGYLDKFYHEMLVNYRNDMTKWKVKDSEDFEDAKERMYNFVVEVAAKHKGQNVLCASHGFAIRALLAKVRGIPSNRIVEVPFCGNTALSIFDVDDDGNVTLELENDFSHLKGSDEEGPLLRKHVDNTGNYKRFVQFDLEKDAELYKKWHPNGNIEKAKEFLARNERAVVMMLLNEEPAGMLELDTAKDRNYGKGWINWYFIEEKERGTSISKVLLGHAISVYKELGRERVAVAVPADDKWLNEYFRYYAFTKTGECVEDGKTLNIMEYDLLI